MRKMFRRFKSDMADVECQDQPQDGAEHKPPGLTSQPSMHDMSDIPTPHGLAKREITKFSDTWNNICKNSLVGKGDVLQAAAITNHAGNVYSNTPDDFIPTIEQIKRIVEAMHKPGIVAMTGIVIGGEKFAYSDCQISGSSAHSFSGRRADGDGGVLVYITKHTIIIGTWHGESNHKREAAVARVEAIWEWVKDTGF